MAGNITIIEPMDNFQKVAKDIIYNKSVDALTLGIYVIMLCLGKEWVLNVKGLASRLNLSSDRIRKSFAILEAEGYLRRTRAHGVKGRYDGWDYEVYAKPMTDIAKKPTSVNSDVGRTPTSENPTLYIDNNLKKETTMYAPPSVDDVASYARLKGFADPEGFAAYYVESQTELGWMTGKGSKRKPIDNWKLNVLAWKRYHKYQIFNNSMSSATSSIIHEMSEKEVRDFFRQ
jgi:hypothetical protein